jgi:hypothetical protein
LNASPRRSTGPTSPTCDIRIDVIFSFSEYERLAISRALAVRVGERMVRFATLEDLIVHKVVAGRPRDLEDVKGLLRRNPGADLGEVRAALSDFAALVGEPFEALFESVLREARG